MKLSIVTTLYHSAPHLQEFYRRIKSEAEKITSDHEFILVNDGSPDNSLEIAISLSKSDRHVKVIDLSRNFGHHKAAMTGLGYAAGDLVFLIDCDLEEKPEFLGQFYHEIKRTGADVVYGVQGKRKGRFLEQFSGHVFYALINLLSDYPVPANVIMAHLMTKDYVSALIKHRDREVFLAGLWAITGFKQIPMVVQKSSKATTTYSFAKKVSLFVNSVTSFSKRPLILIFYIGSLIMLASVVTAGYLVVRRIFFGIYASGWPSIFVSIWFLGGLTIFCLGIIGIYLSKIFNEVKPRPYTIVKKIYSHDKDEMA